MARVDMAQNSPQMKTGWLQSRWPMALIGLILLIIGQVQISSSELPSSPPTQLGQWLNNNLHFDIPSIDNVLTGLPILLIGCFLLLIALRGLRLVPLEKEPEEKKPFAFRWVASSWPGILCALALFGTTLWSLATRDFSLWMAVGWLISLLFIVSVIATWDQHRGINLSPGLTRRDILYMLGLVLIGLVLGAYHLQGMPDSLIADEGSFWTTARDIATGVFKPPIFASGANTFPVLSSYLQALALKLFGINLWGWRFSSVLSGVFTILPLYLLARETFNRKIAITSSMALILSPYFLAFTRLGYNNIQALFITTLALYWLYIGLNRSSHLYLFLAGCAAGLCVYTYFSAGIALLIGIIFIVLMWLARKINIRQGAFSISLLLFGTLMVVGPNFVFHISHETNEIGYKLLDSAFFNASNGELFYSDKELFAFVNPIQYKGYTLFYNPKIYLEMIVRGLTRTLLALQKPAFVTDNFISSSLTGTVGAYFYIVGLGIILWKFKQPRSLFLLLWFFGIVLGLSALNALSPSQTYMVPIIPLLALLIGVGLSVIASIAATSHAKLAKYQTVFLLVVIASIGLGGLYDYFVVMPAKYLPQPDQIMSWAVLNAHEESFYYIYSRPEEQQFKPFIVTEFRPTVPFETISVDSLIQASSTFSTGGKTVVWYTPDLAVTVEPVLQAKWGNGYLQKIFYAADGTPTLAAAMNTPFIFARDQSLLTILKDSYLRPSLLVFLFVLIGLLVFTAVLPIAWARPIPERLKRLVNWFNGPENPADVEADRVEFFEEILNQPITEQPSEPPEWAEEIFQSKPVKVPERLHAEFNRVRQENGKDYYIKIHLPPIKILGFSLLGKVEFALPAFHIPNPVLITLALILAFIAQFMIYRGIPVAGIALYLLSSAGLIIWIRLNSKWTNVFANQWRISPLAEKLLVAVLLAVTAFIRYYDLNFRVYGLEGDEVTWTIQSWYSTILMVGKGAFISHYLYMPLSFWIRSVFLRLFGLNFISARIESATLSLISVVFLYLLVRRLTKSKPLAILSALLYSFSFLDLNLAHQALGETTPEVWIIVSFYFLVLALQERKAWLFQLTGFSLALGMLTFEMFLPSPVIAMVYLTGLGLYEIIKKKTSTRKWLGYLFMVAWPIILTYFVYTQGILNVRRGYDLGVLMQFSGNGSSIIGAILFLFRNANHFFQTIFSHIVWTDTLLYWGGPLINPVLLPFIVIGFIYNFWNIRRPYFILIPLWFFIHAAVGPLALGAVYPRVLYTLLAPLMIWGAMGLWTFLGALRAFFDNQKFRFATPVFCLVLLAIIFTDYHIFTSSLSDATDKQKRRELSDLTAQSAGSVPMILYPYLPNEEDSLAVESSTILFSVAGATHMGNEAQNRFQQLEFSQVLTTLWNDRQLSSLDMFFDKTTFLQDQRTEALNGILRCFPGAVLSESGQFFEIYHFNKETLTQPKCYQGAPPVVIAPQDGAVLPSGDPITFAWNTNGVAATSHSILLEQKVKGTYWIEAEDSFSGPHWVFESRYINDFSGKGFLVDDWQAGEAQYSFPVPEDGRYRVWIKSYKRRVNDQHNFITINGKKMGFAGDSNTLNEWVWEDLGTYYLSAGLLPLTLSRTYGKDEQYSVFIDGLLITSDLINPPDQVKVWNSIVDSGEVPSSTSKYTLPELLAPGDYRWKVHIYDGTFLVDFTGSRGLETPMSTFTITP